MQVSELEFTRHVSAGVASAGSSAAAEVGFALGIRIRPLLTRVQAWPQDASAATGAMGAWLENGNDVPTGATFATLQADSRLAPVWMMDYALATNGMGMAVPFESTWWKLLQPDVRIHVVSSVLTNFDITVILHYRFAELTGDEIIELAAQRAQG